MFFYAYFALEVMVKDKRMDGWTDGRTDRQTDVRAKPVGTLQLIRTAA